MYNNTGKYLKSWRKMEKGGNRLYNMGRVWYNAHFEKRIRMEPVGRKKVNFPGFY